MTFLFLSSTFSTPTLTSFLFSSHLTLFSFFISSHPLFSFSLFSLFPDERDFRASDASDEEDDDDFSDSSDDDEEPAPPPAKKKRGAALAAAAASKKKPPKKTKKSAASKKEKKRRDPRRMFLESDESEEEETDKKKKSKKLRRSGSNVSDDSGSGGGAGAAANAILASLALGPVPLPSSTALAAAEASAVLAHREEASFAGKITTPEAFRVKLKGHSHRAAVWVPAEELRLARPALARAFLQRKAAAAAAADDAASRGGPLSRNGVADFDENVEGEETIEEEDLVDGVHADWTTVDRVMSVTDYIIQEVEEEEESEEEEEEEEEEGEEGKEMEVEGEAKVEVEVGAPSNVDDNNNAAAVVPPPPSSTPASSPPKEKKPKTPLRFPPGSRRPAALVKWCGLGYAEATWEWCDELTRKGDAEALSAFEAKHAEKGPFPSVARTPVDKMPVFLGGRELRSYQQESLRWMMANRYAGRNCILGDEMGLGKTAQSAAALAFMRQFQGLKPFLVVAPLTTLGHWAREVSSWTGLDVVSYVGSASDRAVCRAADFFRADDPSKPSFDVLLTSYEIMLKDKSFLTDKRLPWAAVVVDEAHRLKTSSSAARGALVDVVAANGGKTSASKSTSASSSSTATTTNNNKRWLLLLTGTPVQNNMRELHGLLNVLDPKKPEWASEEAFFASYGGGARASAAPPTLAQVRLLQEHLRPILLRRMKEDVEKSLPTKEEVVVRVELTRAQRVYYRAIYERQVAALLGGGSKANLPNLRNLAMELRKVCCHPWLCNGLEEDSKARRAEARALRLKAEQEAKGEKGGKEEGTAAATAAASGALVPSSASAPPPLSPHDDDLAALVEASGKMVLISKLLPKLKAENKKVLIFSQFKMMLDVLEDACRGWGHAVERIDGGVPHRERQQAIDRFSKPGATSDEAFVFLLSTRAGGQGITLTAADTCVIYDSDFNPQNDLQAMARCHRIGQQKDVTVYRLISNDTYEQSVFETASRKYGLDEAILGTMEDAAAVVAAAAKAGKRAGALKGTAGAAATAGNATASAANNGAADVEADAARIAALLKHGAHAIFNSKDGDDGGDAAANGTADAFASEDIDSILRGRTEKRQIGSRAGNSFSVATFAAEKEEEEEDGEEEEEDDDEDLVSPGGTRRSKRGGGRGGGGRGRRRGGGSKASDERDYWARVLPDAVAAHDEAAAAALAGGSAALGPRQRRAVVAVGTGGTLNEAALTAAAERRGGGSGSGSGKSKNGSGDFNEDDDDEPGRWYKYEVEAVLASFLTLGEGRPALVLAGCCEEGGSGSYKNRKVRPRPEGEVEELTSALAQIIRRAAADAAARRDAADAADALAAGRPPPTVRFAPDPMPPAVRLTSLPKQFRRAIIDADVQLRAEKDAEKVVARHAAAAASGSTSGAATGKQLVPGWAERLDTLRELRRLLAAQETGTAEEAEAATRALRAVSASAAKRTTAPHWWKAQHDRALLSAVAQRGSTPGIKMLSEVGAILRDHSLKPLPLAPECEAFVEQRVSSELAQLERQRAIYDRALKTRNALECSYKSECEAAASLGQEPPQMPMLPLLPPEPPSASVVPSPEEAAVGCWQALVGGVTKRLTRLLEGVLHPSSTVILNNSSSAAAAAAYTQRSRGGSAERASNGGPSSAANAAPPPRVNLIADARDVDFSAAGASAGALAPAAQGGGGGSGTLHQTKPYDIVALMHRARAKAEEKRLAREARETSAVARGGGEGEQQQQQQQQQQEGEAAEEEEPRITLRLASTPPNGASSLPPPQQQQQPHSTAVSLAAQAERLAAVAGLPPSAALAARAAAGGVAAAVSSSPQPRRSPRVASSPSVGGVGAGAGAPPPPPPSSSRKRKLAPSSSPPPQEQRDPNSEGAAAPPPSSRSRPPSGGKAAALLPPSAVATAAAAHSKRPLPPAVAAALMFKQTTLAGSFPKK